MASGPREEFAKYSGFRDVHLVRRRAHFRESQFFHGSNKRRPLRCFLGNIAFEAELLFGAGDRDDVRGQSGPRLISRLGAIHRNHPVAEFFGGNPGS
jgi:hypothetical protein